jgi:hypothetical protein
MNSATRKMTCQIIVSLYFYTLAVVLILCTYKESLTASSLLKNGTCAHVSTIVPPFRWRNPNAPRTERNWMKEETHWPEYDVFHQSYLSLGKLARSRPVTLKKFPYFLSYNKCRINCYLSYRDELSFL